MIRMINDWGWKIKDSKSINDFPQLDYLFMKLFCDLLFSMTTDLIFLFTSVANLMWTILWLCLCHMSIVCCQFKFVACEFFSIQFYFYGRNWQ